MAELKLIITTDFHASRRALTGLRELLKLSNYDAVIMAGDLINPDDRELSYVKDFISLIKEEAQLPLFGLHGNNEPATARVYYREAEINIHLQNRPMGSYNVCGIGGFGTLEEPGFEDLDVNKLFINQRTIFVTHVPPNQNSTVSGIGPLIHISGHKHVLAFKKLVNRTVQIQCPAGLLGKVTELSLPDLAVNFIELPNFRVLRKTGGSRGNR